MRATFLHFSLVVNSKAPCSDSIEPREMQELCCADTVYLSQVTKNQKFKKKPVHSELYRVYESALTKPYKTILRTTAIAFR